MRYVVALLIVILAVSLVGANGYYGGYRYFTYYPTYYYPTLPTYNYNYQPSYGYGNTNYYDGGYHYHNAGYYQGTYYPAGYYAWQNNGWVAQQNYTQTPPNWKAQIVEIAKQREENKEFQDALKSLGISNLSGPGGYGRYSNNNAYLGTYGANGSTVYGYSYSTVKDLYGSTDLNTLFQQAQRLAQNAQALGGQATQDFQQAVSLEGNNRSRVAEILARGQAATQALSAAQGSGSTTTQTTTNFRIEPGKQPQVQGQIEQQQQPGAARANVQISPEFAGLASQKCLKCHGGEKTEGKFDVREYPAMSPKDKQRVWSVLLTSDKEHRMPKGANPLTPEEMMIFFRN